MSGQTSAPERPQVVSDSFQPVSIFLCPCRVSPGRLKELAQRALASDQEDGGGILTVPLDPFEEECLGLNARIQPRLFFLEDLDWVVLALFAELSPQPAGTISFEQLLAFNSNLRVCQGELERQDTPVVGHQRLEFALSGGGDTAQVFRRIAEKALGVYEPPEALKRTVTLSMAQFDRPLDDAELYALGTIAHSDEAIDPAWAAEAAQEHAYDRWRSLGIRYFVHSYSLVCSHTRKGDRDSREPASLLKMFLKEYVQMGVRLALERADSLEFRAALQEIETLKELRQKRQRWIASRRILGVRWTAEGTQKARIEQLWRQVSGLEKMTEEIDGRFSQTVDLFEARAAEQLNGLLTWFEIVVVGLAAGHITAVLTAESGYRTALPWTIGITLLVMFLCWLGLYFRVMRQFRRKK